jgi:histidine triad (HIT) family protein
MFDTYNPDNIFVKIINKDIAAQIVFEDDHVIAFHDINPKAKIHILIIPKAHYICFQDFTEAANPDMQLAFYKAIARIAKEKNIDKTGYRLISNCKTDGGQEVPHFHMHLLGGEPLENH